MKKRPLIVWALGLAVPIFVFGAEAHAQVVITSCYETDESKPTAWHVPGFGANCGTYSCPHDIIDSEDYSEFRWRRKNETGWDECVYLPIQDASLCHMILWTCAPLGCVNTGILHYERYIQTVPSGQPCTE